MNVKLVSVFAVLLAATLAGCTEPDPDPHEDLGVDTYAVTVGNMPESVAAGYGFDLEIGVVGIPGFMTDHAGAHFGNTSSTTPSTTVYNVGCTHTGGDLPATFSATCTPTEPGLFFLRGHMRASDEHDTWNYWSVEEFPFNVVAVDEATYAVSAAGVPSMVEAGSTFSFIVQAAGPQGPTTNHVGAHFGSTSSAEPSTSVYDKSCMHGNGPLPGSFEVSCTAGESGTIYLRSHLRIEHEGEMINYWGNEIAVTVG